MIRPSIIICNPIQYELVIRLTMRCGCGRGGYTDLENPKYGEFHIGCTKCLHVYDVLFNREELKGLLTSCFSIPLAGIDYWVSGYELRMT